MILNVPDHYGQTMATAFLVYGREVIEINGIVPAFLYQLADVWDKNFRYGNRSYWQAIVDTSPSILVTTTIVQNGLLDAEVQDY